MSDVKPYHSTGKDDWETPEEFFNIQESLYGKFDLDACASKENAKCDKFFDQEQDGLSQKWFGNVWCNPPYSKGQPDLWINKAISEVVAKNAAQVVMLLRCDTSTNRWHNLITPHAFDWEFIHGRIKFVGSEGGAPFPSVIVVFKANAFLLVDGERLTIEQIAERYNLTLNTIKYRVSQGWDMERIISTPLEQTTSFIIDGKMMTISDIVEKYKLSTGYIYDQLSKGIRINDIIKNK